MIPFGAGISVSLPIADDLSLHRDVATWIAASYPWVTILSCAIYCDSYEDRIDWPRARSFWQVAV